MKKTTLAGQVTMQSRLLTRMVRILKSLLAQATTAGLDMPKRRYRRRNRWMITDAKGKQRKKAEAKTATAVPRKTGHKTPLKRTKEEED